MIPVVIPNILKRLFPRLIWDYTTQEKEIYLTFDDGPEPEITTQVLAFLSSFNAKATFFTLGEKAEKHPEIIKQIQDEGHVCANHGYNHMSGFSSNSLDYFQNYQKGAAFTQKQLFRPPYGRITPKQIKSILPHSKIIMWSIMSMDFNKNTTTGKCIRNVLDNAYPGAIVVFHDTKQSLCLLKSLPVILKSLKESGYKFKTIC
jgi:peptidoglycan/xylan/chitin deacetylase (PgdA/CDA1 family)